MRIDEHIIPIPAHLPLRALPTITTMRLLPVSLDPMRSFAILTIVLGFRRVGDELRLSGLTEEDTMLDGRRGDGRSIGLFCCRCGSLQRVSCTADARGGGAATELDRASAFDVDVGIVSKGVAVVVSGGAGARVGFRVAVQGAESIAVRCGSAGSIVRGIDGLAAGAG